MNCEYCGSTLGQSALGCRGCGAPRTSPVASSNPWGTAKDASSRRNREMEIKLDHLFVETGILKRKAVLDDQWSHCTEQYMTAATLLLIAAIVVLFWKAPALIPLAVMFFVFVYLPFFAFKRLIGWLTS